MAFARTLCGAGNGDHVVDAHHQVGDDDGLDGGQLRRVDEVGLADDDHVGEFDLFGQQAAQAALVAVAGDLAALGQEVGAVKVM